MDPHSLDTDHTQVLDILFNETEGLLRDETPITLPLPDLDTLTVDYYYNNLVSCTAGTAASDNTSLSTSPNNMRDSISIGEHSPTHSDSGISLDEIPSPKFTCTLQGVGSCDHNYSTIPADDTNINMDFQDSLFLDDFCFDDLNLKLGYGQVDSSVSNEMLSVFDGMDFLEPVDSDFHVDFAELPLDLLGECLTEQPSSNSPIEDTTSPTTLSPSITDGNLSDPGSDESGDSDIITSTTDITDCHSSTPISANRIIKIITIGKQRSGDNSTLPFTVKDVRGKPSESLSYPDLRLSEEEKQLLAQEGIVLPTNMPLTKDEERSLKSVRRKIRNKISAKTSRKRKMEYVDGLEKRVKMSTVENSDLKKRVHSLEHQNNTLLSQLKKLQALVSTKSNRPAQTTTCIMVLALSFMFILLPSYNPLNLFQSGNSEIRPLPIPGKSRSLLHKPDDMMAASTSADDPYGSTKWPIPPWDHPDSPIREAVVYTSMEDDEHNKPLNRIKRGFVFGEKEAEIKTYHDDLKELQVETYHDDLKKLQMKTYDEERVSSSSSTNSLPSLPAPAQKNKTVLRQIEEDKLPDPDLHMAAAALHNSEWSTDL